MVLLLTMLEPRFESRYFIFADELEDVQVINFVSKGSVVVGYEINKIRRYCLKLKE
jgi:hypothetical protein